MKRTPLRTEHRKMLVGLYECTQRTVDELPYTEEFERLFESFLQRTGIIMTRHDFWRTLASLRNGKQLVRKER